MNKSFMDRISQSLSWNCPKPFVSHIKRKGCLMLSICRFSQLQASTVWSSILCIH